MTRFVIPIIGLLFALNSISTNTTIQNMKTFKEWQIDTINTINDFDVHIIKNKDYLELQRYHRYNNDLMNDYAEQIVDDISVYIDLPEEYIISFKEIRGYSPSTFESKIYDEFFELQDINISSENINIEIGLMRGRVNYIVSINNIDHNSVREIQYWINNGKKIISYCILKKTKDCK